MVSQLSTNGEALRLFFTEDIYFVNEDEINVPVADVGNAAIDFKFLGKNKRNILILVNDEQNEVSDEIGRELLRKIVKSVNLTADDFALLNYAKYSNTNFEQLMTYFNSNVVFAFGVTPSSLTLSAHPENTIVHEGTVKLIFSATLPQLNQDANGKKALWGCLKNLGI